VRSTLPHLVDLALNRLDANANPAPIRFELRLTRAARADSAAQARQGGARADQPRQKVLELCELDLPLAFARSRAAGEDVKDELGAIDDLPFETILELTQLRRRQLVVEDDGVDLGLGTRRGKRGRLAAADERRASDRLLYGGSIRTPGRPPPRFQHPFSPYLKSSRL
jgi:hypothetical protein